jgi:bacillithiol synthase
MRIETVQWRHSQPLAKDYIHQFDKVSEQFDYHPWEVDKWAKRAAWLDAALDAPRADSSLVADALLAYNERIGNKPAALAAIGELRRGALAVVGGQQAGLFGGPLLTVYKAVTLIQASREASRQLDRHVVPVFWIAGEDHDFEEVNHFFYANGEASVEKLQINMKNAAGARTSVSRLKLDEAAWTEAVHMLEKSLPDSPNKAELLGRIAAIVSKSATLVDVFARLMAELFGESGLVLLNADDPMLRKVEAPMFEKLISRNKELNDTFLKSVESLTRMGYRPQVEISPESANLFIFEKQTEARLLLQRDGSDFIDKKRALRLTEGELLALASEQPEQLSNNVLTRPLMQEYLFPVLGTVLGPGEIAYWALTRGAFHVLGMTMPIVLPRLEYTLVDDRANKYLLKYDLSIEDVGLRLQERKAAWLLLQDTDRFGERFNAAFQQIRGAYEPLIASVTDVLPGLKELGAKNVERILEEIAFMKEKTESYYRNRYLTGAKHWERLEVSLLPLAKPQERVYNVVAYLNKFGDGWLCTMLDTPTPIDGKHRILYI